MMGTGDTHYVPASVSDRTSANGVGSSPATAAADVQDPLGSETDLIVDDGLTPGGQPSTVLQLVGDIRILRQGAISRDRLQQVLDLNSIQLSVESRKQT